MIVKISYRLASNISHDDVSLGEQLKESQQRIAHLEVRIFPDSLISPNIQYHKSGPSLVFL